MTGYCVKCRKTRDMKDTEQIVMKNGRPATKGICPVCGTKILKSESLMPNPDNCPICDLPHFSVEGLRTCNHMLAEKIDRIMPLLKSFFHLV